MTVNRPYTTGAAEPFPRIFARYGLAGSVGTAAHYIVMWSTIDITSTVAASTSGAVVGCLVNFLLSRHFVFQARGPVAKCFARFAIVAVCGVIVNAVVLAALMTTFSAFPSQLIATATVLTLGFMLNRWWTFHE